MKCRICGLVTLTTGDVDQVCIMCRNDKNSWNNEKFITQMIKTKFDEFAKNQKDIPQEYVDIINKNFWNLI